MERRHVAGEGLVSVSVCVYEFTRLTFPFHPPPPPPPPRLQMSSCHIRWPPSTTTFRYYVCLVENYKPHLNPAGVPIAKWTTPWRCFSSFMFSHIHMHLRPVWVFVRKCVGQGVCVFVSLLWGFWGVKGEGERERETVGGMRKRKRDGGRKDDNEGGREWWWEAESALDVPSPHSVCWRTRDVAGLSVQNVCPPPGAPRQLRINHGPVDGVCETDETPALVCPMRTTREELGNDLPSVSSRSRDDFVSLETEACEKGRRDGCC